MGAMTLGNLFWYKAGEPTVTTTELLKHAESIGMDVSLLPRQILPVDVFRRMTGTSGLSAKYTVDPYSVRLEIQPGKDTQKMLSRVVTRSCLVGTRVVDRIEVIDFVFYHPPRGEIARSRIRTTPRNLAELPDRDKIERFARELRDEYHRGLEFLDAQGVRRLVRSYLAGHDAVSIGNVYFLPPGPAAGHLCRLLEVVGNSRGYTMEIADTPDHTALIEEARQPKKGDAGG